MQLTKKKKATQILEEGTYESEVEAIVGKPNDIAPKKLIGTFPIKDTDIKLTKEWPASIDDGTPFCNDAETILGKKVGDDFQTEDLVGHRCQVLVMHKAGTGGKAKAVVGVIQAAAKPAPAARK